MVPDLLGREGFAHGGKEKASRKTGQATTPPPGDGGIRWFAARRPRIWRARSAYGNPASVGPPRSRYGILSVVARTAEAAVVIRDRGYNEIVSVSRAAADVVSRSPNVLSGTPVFTGTRVPVQALLDHLEAADSLDVFLNSFPSVTREHAIAFLEMAKEVALADLNEGTSRRVDPQRSSGSPPRS